MSSQTDAWRQTVVEGVQVTKQLVACAEAFLYQATDTRASVSSLLDKLLEHHGVQWPKKIMLNPAGGNEDVLDNLARATHSKDSWRRGSLESSPQRSVHTGFSYDGQHWCERRLDRRPV